MFSIPKLKNLLKLVNRANSNAILPTINDLPAITAINWKTNGMSTDVTVIYMLATTGKIRRKVWRYRRRPEIMKKKKFYTNAELLTTFSKWRKCIIFSITLKI